MMETVIIDRSLCGLKFHDIFEKENVYLYVDALHEIGADYVEIDRNALSYLPDPSVRDRYIFRIETADEVQIANSFPFSYVLLPLGLAHLASRLNVPHILEICFNDVEPLAFLGVVADNIDLTRFALLRIVGDFNYEPQEFRTFMEKYRIRYSVPIDICSLNSSMMALSSSIAAYFASADAITVAFGNGGIFTPFEELAVSLASFYKIMFREEYVSGICQATVLAPLFCGLETPILKILMSHYLIFSRFIKTIDTFSDETEFRRILLKKPQNNFLRGKLKNFNYSSNSKNKLLEHINDALKSCSVNLSSNSFSDNKKNGDYLN